MNSTSPIRGRPRKVEDEVVFLALTQLIEQHGLAGVTLQRVARVAGCSQQMLSHRFPSGGLLSAYALWMSNVMREQMDAIVAAESSPVAAIAQILRMTIATSPPGRIGINASWLQVMLDLRRDQEVAAEMALLTQDSEDLVTGLVERAQRTGELTDAVPAREITETILALVTGAVAKFILNPAEPLIPRIERFSERALAFYRPD